jgi:hypothetical protein
MNSQQIQVVHSRRVFLLYSFLIIMTLFFVFALYNIGNTILFILY